MATSINGATLTGPTDPGSLTDSSGGVWTLSGGVISHNGVADTITALVTLLLYFGGLIYQEAHGSWWSWTTNAWLAAAGDPRPAVPPVTLPPTTLSQTLLPGQTISVTAPPSAVVPPPKPPTFTQVLAVGESISVSAQGAMTVIVSA